MKDLNERIRKIKHGSKRTNYIGNDSRTLETLFDIHNMGYRISFNNGRIYVERKELKTGKRGQKIFHETRSSHTIVIRETTREAIWKIWIAIMEAENAD